MAQLRHDYDKFAAAGARIVVIGPESPQAFKSYFLKEKLPFIGLPDPSHLVLKLLGQRVNLFKLGRMPGQIIVDKAGNVRYIHYGHDMTDIPANEEILALLKSLNQELT
ncbi:MAG: redoxin domain-containing protein [Anaerolineaceae bacterium]|nr:redoxin domain-containing protein [Anaerolineaceae bacterium]